MKGYHQTSSLVMVVPLLGLAACTAPDLSGPLGDAHEVASATREALAPDLATRHIVELREGELAGAAAGKVLLHIPDECLILMNTDLGLDATGCVPISAIEVELEQQVGSAAHAQRSLRVIESYFVALSALASPDGVDNLGAAAGEFQGALDTLAQSDRASLRDAGERLSEAFLPGPALITLISDQARIAALRRAMADGGSALSDLVRDLEVILIEMDPSLSDQREATTLAYGAYIALYRNGTGSDIALADAAQAVRVASKQQQKVEAESPIRALYLLRDLHDELLESLNKGGELSDLGRLVDQVRDLAQAIEEQDE